MSHRTARYRPNTRGKRGEGGSDPQRGVDRRVATNETTRHGSKTMAHPRIGVPVRLSAKSMWCCANVASSARFILDVIQEGDECGRRRRRRRRRSRPAGGTILLTRAGKVATARQAEEVALQGSGYHLGETDDAGSQCDQGESIQRSRYSQDPGGLGEEEGAVAH